jgi:hypothetical protein
MSKGHRSEDGGPQVPEETGVSHGFTPILDLGLAGFVAFRFVSLVVHDDLALVLPLPTPRYGRSY